MPASWTTRGGRRVFAGWQQLSHVPFQNSTDDVCVVVLPSLKYETVTQAQSVQIEAALLTCLAEVSRVLHAAD